jgi:hypothetical protein
MTPREIWSNPSDVPGQLFSTLPTEYLNHYSNFTSKIGPIVKQGFGATLYLPDTYFPPRRDHFLPNISCPWDDYAIVEVNATLESDGGFNLTLLPEPLPPKWNPKTPM